MADSSSPCPKPLTTLSTLTLPEALNTTSFASFQQMVADLRGGGADSTETGGRVGVNAPTAVRWNVIEERLADQTVAEPILACRTSALLDDQVEPLELGQRRPKPLRRQEPLQQRHDREDRS